MSPDAIKEKIKKLLRMKRGGTQGEIENALAAAAKLAREHGIDLNSVDPDEQTETITHATDELKLKMPIEARLAANILVNFFNVQVCVHQGRMSYRIKYKVTFVGSAWDIEIARYIFVFLQRHFRWSWNHRQNKRLKNRDAFLHGMYLGLGAKLEKDRDTEVTGNALVLVGRAVERRKEYLAKLLPQAKDQNLDIDDSNADASKYAGVIAGMNTEIRKAMHRSAAPVRPALPPTAGQLALI